MGKITLWCLLTVGILAQAESLEKNCLSCHKTQQIPNNLIYKRYLLKYSSQDRIAKAMFFYLKNSNKSDSIMPPQFFLKFPMKPSLKMDDSTLKEGIRDFITTFDVKRRLRVGK